MFSGDFIFKESVGRCDLPGGNIGDMIKSINKIKEYDDDIVIYPGHGDSTTIGYEKNNNIYFFIAYLNLKFHDIEGNIGNNDI